MYLDLNRFPFMGMHNSDTFLPEKDPNAMEFDLLVGPTLEFQDDQDSETASASQDGEEHCRNDDGKFPSSELEIKVPSLDVQSDGGAAYELKTPTSLDHRIPSMLKCPPAPKKPKSLPSAKRKEVLRRKILLDLTKEIESLFPTALLADLGNKIKKVRQGSDFK